MAVLLGQLPLGFYAFQLLFALLPWPFLSAVLSQAQPQAWPQARSQGKKYLVPASPKSMNPKSQAKVAPVAILGPAIVTTLQTFQKTKVL